MTNFSFIKNNEIKKNSTYLFLFIVFSVAVFFPTLFGDPFWDDWVFIFKKTSEMMTASTPIIFFPGGSAAKAWPIFHLAIWCMLKFFKEHYFYYHLINLTLHGANGFLCWRILEKVKSKNSLFLAMLYLVHPLQIFTVAWIIQLKTILSIFFFLNSLIFLLRYFDNEKKSSIICALIFFTLSILTKSTTASFALCLFLAFPLLKNKINAKKFIIYFAAPLIVISTVSAVRTAWNFNIREYFSKEEINTPYQNFTKVDRAVISTKLFLRYAVFTVFPYGGNHLFQKKTILDYSPFEFLLNVAGLVLIYYIFAHLIELKLHLEFFGLLFFCITLLPFCGIVFIPIFFTSNFIPYWLSIPFLGLLPLISYIIRSNKILIVIVGIFTIVSHSQAYGFIQTEEIFLDSIKISPEAKIYQISLVEHYIFTHQCKAATETYNQYFEKISDPPYNLKEKLKNCQSLTDEQL